MNDVKTETYRLDGKDRIINVLLYAVTLALLGTMALQLNNPPVLDEVGTMANTAFLAGYDWTECVMSMGNHYYKLGMPLLYYPAFMLIKAPFVLYRVCIFINTVLISFVPVFAYTIVRKHMLPTSKLATGTVLTDRVIPALLALAVGLLPSVDLHSLYAKSDPMLIFLAWPISLCILEGLDAVRADNKKKNYICSILAGFLSVYAYFSHTRGVVVIIALVMTNLAMHIFTRKKPFAWIPYIASTGAFMVLERIVSGFIKRNVLIYGTKHGTLDSAGLGELKHLASRSGILSMVKLIIGWLYNVFAASYGMIIIGLFVTIFLIFKTFAYKKSYGSREAIPYKETAFAAFSFLNFCGSFAMGALFFFRPVHQFFLNADSGRADRVVFGRYTVCTVGPVVLIALFCLIYRSDLLGIKTKIVSVCCYAIIFLLFVFYVSPWLDGHSANSRYFISLCTFMKYPYEGGTSAVIENMCEALKYAGLLAFGIFAAVLFLSLKVGDKGSELYAKLRNPLMLGLIAVYSLIIICVNFTGARLARDKFLYSRVNKTASVLNDIAEKTDIEEKYPFVLIIDTNLNIKHHQAASIAYNFGTYKTRIADMDNMFIVAEKNRFLSRYCDDDYYLFDSFDYKKPTKDIVYVKGEALAAELKAAGYSLTKYTGELLSGKH